MFIYDDNVLTENDFIELHKKIKKLKFSFISQAVKPGDKGYHFINDILDRKGNKSKDYSYFKSVLVSILKKHNIKLNKVHRIAINYTFNNGYVKEVPLHLDHDFPHKQIIFYLNTSTGNTEIPFYNKIITPKENTAILFDNIEHKHYFPEKGIRAVCVFTFV